MYVVCLSWIKLPTFFTKPLIFYYLQFPRDKLNFYPTKQSNPKQLDDKIELASKLDSSNYK